MDVKSTFEKELNKLTENEDNITHLREILNKDIGNTKEYKLKVERLLQFSKENNLARSRAWGYYFLGWYYFDICEHEKSVVSFMISYELFDKLKNKHEIAYACNGLTNIYCRIGQYKLSNEWGLKGISFCEETGNDKAMITLLLNTFANYVQMEYYDKALEIMDSIRGMEVELTASQRIVYLFSKAEIEINTGCPENALRIIDEAMKVKPTAHTNAVISEMLKLKGMAYLKGEKYKLAEEQFESSFYLSVKHELAYEKCSTMLQWSKLYILTEKYDKAIELINDIIIIGSPINCKHIEREAFDSLYCIYKKRGDTEKALYYLEEYKKVDDEMYDYEQSQIMAKMNLMSAKRIAEQYKQLYERTELLSTIGQRIISSLDISSIIYIIYEEISKLIDADYFGVAVYDSIKEQAVYYFMKDYMLISETIDFKQEDSFGGYCIKNKKDIIIGNEKLEYKKYLNIRPQYNQKLGEGNISSIIYTPMIINEKVVGLMTVQNEKENLYGKDELNILKILANYSAIAVENARTYKEIKNIAIYDSMTGFLTKAEILNAGDKIFEKAQKNNDKFTVIMMDLDGFKTINDTHGHIYGDRAMSLIAKTISKCIRNTDYIGRFGGDEFLLICSGTGLKEALDVAERIRKTIGSSLFVFGDEVNISLTMSLGVHECEEKDYSFTDVVKRADEYLYHAKETRNTVTSQLNYAV